MHYYYGPANKGPVLHRELNHTLCVLTFQLQCAHQISLSLSSLRFRNYCLPCLSKTVSYKGTKNAMNWSLFVHVQKLNFHPAAGFYR